MKYKSVLLALVLTGSMFPLVQCSGAPVSGGASATTKRYLTAVQHKDFKTMLEVNANYQEAIKNIKQGNPQVLWTKLIDQYTESQTQQIGRDPIFTLVPPSAQWSISEQRPEGQTQTSVYVTMHYPSVADAPIYGDGRLKDTILQVEVSSPGQNILSVSTVQAANAFWPIPSLSSEVALQLIKQELPAIEFVPHLSCYTATPPESGQMPYCSITLPQNTTPKLAELIKFYSDHGFDVKPFKMQEGWGANGTQAQPPQSWASLILTGNGDTRTRSFYNQPNKGYVNFKLTESTDLNIGPIESTPDGPAHVKTTLHLIHSGCTAACTLLRDYWGKGGRDYYGGFTSQFFAASYVGGGGEGMRWPTEETHNIEFTWDTRSLSWVVVSSSLGDQKF
jgi:hypothetical protein